MLALDLLSHSSHSLMDHPLGTCLSLLGVGVAAVVLLSGLGESSRRYLTNLIAIMPGKV